MRVYGIKDKMMYVNNMTISVLHFGIYLLRKGCIFLDIGRISAVAVLFIRRHNANDYIRSGPACAEVVARIESVFT